MNDVISLVGLASLLASLHNEPYALVDAAGRIEIVRAAATGDHRVLEIVRPL